MQVISHLPIHPHVGGSISICSNLIFLHSLFISASSHLSLILVIHGQHNPNSGIVTVDRPGLTCPPSYSHILRLFLIMSSSEPRTLAIPNVTIQQLCLLCSKYKQPRQGNRAHRLAYMRGDIHAICNLQGTKIC